MTLIYFDTETTGVDPYQDRIIELAMFGELGERLLVARVNPGMPIPAEATAVNGITDADVANAPPFDEVAPRVQELLGPDVVLVGFCNRRFDTVLLHNELVRAGQPGLPTDKYGRIQQPEIDLFELWRRHEDRKLVTAARRFAGVDIGQDAHSATADSRVLPKVLRGMCEQFGLDAEDVQQLCQLSIPDGAVDRDGKFIKVDGVIVFNFGKGKGRPAESDLGMLGWVTKQAFMTPETKRIAGAIMDRAYRRLSA